MLTKNFGLIKATIDKAQKRITLEYSKRGKQPLDKNHPQRCLSWALVALAEFTDQGYVITVPEASASG